jgi:aspartyl-tRNA(Asn)/glutamyl-tRNA(Gln) amidotransferase subunit C
VPRNFTTEDVDRLAALARVELTDDERKLFARQLSAILTYAEQVQDVDTSGIPPTSHAAAALSAFREDQPRPSLSRAEVLSQAPEADHQAGLFKVPRVLG